MPGIDDRDLNFFYERFHSLMGFPFQLVIFRDTHNCNWKRNVIARPNHFIKTFKFVNDFGTIFLGRKIKFYIKMHRPLFYELQRRQVT